MNSFLPVTPDQITIAVTVFSRRQYVKRAVASALNQTMPVRVIVVEDCGPDATLKDFVQAEFGSAIEYYRNPTRRGLFDNWNACLDYCKSEWLSILHDDDYLAPTCVASIVKLSQHEPGCALYFGHAQVVDEVGKPWPEFGPPRIAEQFRRITLRESYHGTPAAFAGTVFSTAAVRLLGGFNPFSQFAGDWEMWSKLLARFGGAATRDHVSYVLGHCGIDRGSIVVEREGKHQVLNYVQRKRIIALLKEQGTVMPLDRRRVLASAPVSIRMLLDHGARMSPRLLRYNLKLLALSRAANWRYGVVKVLLGAIGWKGVQILSRAWTCLKS